MQPLTERERQVLERLCHGFTSKEIARELQLSPRTVDVYRGSLLHKAGARNTLTLVSRTLSNGQAGPLPRPSPSSTSRAGK
jgi:DNA-binding NarL/FixJ family response regulator